MKLLVLISILVATTAADFQGYSVPTPPSQTYSNGGCKEGEILHVDGKCVVPMINRRLFVYSAPEQPQPYGPPPYIPPPKVTHNIVFIRTPEQGQGPDPIIVPPPRENNIVYVLNKLSDQGQRVIEVPAPPQKNPEVYYINYSEGDNPTLPGGIDFQTALNSAIDADGQLISGAGGSGSTHGVLGGGFVSSGDSHETDDDSLRIGLGTGFGGNVGIGGGGAFGAQSVVQTPGVGYNPPTATYKPPSSLYSTP